MASIPPPFGCLPSIYVAYVDGLCLACSKSQRRCYRPTAASNNTGCTVAYTSMCACHAPVLLTYIYRYALELLQRSTHLPYVLLLLRAWKCVRNLLRACVSCTLPQNAGPGQRDSHCMPFSHSQGKAAMVAMAAGSRNRQRLSRLAKTIQVKIVAS